MKKKILFGLFLLCNGLIISAQPEWGLHLMRHTLQSSKTNPALLPEGKFVVALPHIYNNLHLTGPTFGDLLTENAAGEPSFNVDHVLTKLKPQNFLRENFDVETLGFAFGLGKVQVSLHHAVRFGAYIDYPNTLPELIWNGNAQYIGQTINLDHDLQISGYNEFGVGTAFKIWKFTAGVRAKFLTGVGDVSTDRHEASLYTDDDVYQLTLQSDYRANTSAYLTYEGIDDIEADLDFGRFRFKHLFTKNTGFAFDLGLKLELGKLDLAASVIDIGKINWSDHVRNYSSKGTFHYDGLDISQAIGGDSVTIGNALDTLESIFQVVETNEKYATDLPSKMYLSASYQLTDILRLGALFYRESYREQDFVGFAVGANADLLKWLQVGATYGILEDNYANVGLNATLKLGPVQLLAATDNVLAVINPDNANFSNLRLGMNLVF